MSKTRNSQKMKAGWVPPDCPYISNLKYKRVPDSAINLGLTHADVFWFAVYGSVDSKNVRFNGLDPLSPVMQEIKAEFLAHREKFRPYIEATNRDREQFRLTKYERLAALMDDNQDTPAVVVPVLESAVNNHQCNLFTLSNDANRYSDPPDDIWLLDTDDVFLEEIDD